MRRQRRKHRRRKQECAPPVYTDPDDLLAQEVARQVTASAVADTDPDGDDFADDFADVHFDARDWEQFWGGCPPPDPQAALDGDGDWVGWRVDDEEEYTDDEYVYDEDEYANECDAYEESDAAGGGGEKVGVDRVPVIRVGDHLGTVFGKMLAGCTEEEIVRAVDHPANVEQQIVRWQRENSDKRFRDFRVHDGYVWITYVER